MEVIPTANELSCPKADVVVNVKRVNLSKRSSRSSAHRKTQAGTTKSSRSPRPKKKAVKKIAAVKKAKKAVVEKKLKISSHPQGSENVPNPSTICNASSSQFSGISFPQPSTLSNSNLTFDEIANELLSSFSDPNIFASGVGNEVTLQSSSFPSVSVQQSQGDMQPQEFVDSFSNSATVGDSLNLASQNSAYFELDLSQFLMLFSTIFEACLAPRLIFSDFPFSSTRLFMYKQLLFNDILGSIQKLLFKPSLEALVTPTTWPACISAEQLFTIFSNSAQKLGVNLI